MADIAINPVSRRVQFTGNGGAGPFAFTFNILADEDIAVYKNTTLLTLTTNYSVSTNADGTGSVTLTSAILPTDVLTIIGGRELERTTDFVTAGDLLASSLNEQLDSLVIMAQQLDEKLSRSVKVNPGDVFTDLELPGKDARKGTVLGFNATSGDPEAGPEIADVSSLAAITADISTLADIEDGTDATDAIQTAASISSDISTVSGISSDVSTVAGVQNNVGLVANSISNVNTVATNINKVDTVSTNISDVTTVAGDLNETVSEINTVAFNLNGSNTIGTVATNIASVNTVATNIADVITVANDLNEAVSEVVTVADDLNEAVSEIDTVANSISNVDAVGTNISNVNTVAGISSDVTTVAGISANTTTVAGISANVTTVAGISSDVTAVAADATDIGTVAGISANVSTVAGLSSSVSTLALISSDITTVAGISANVTTVAGDTANIATIATNLNGTNTIGTVAGSISNVNSVGGAIADVSTVASNLTDVQSFANTYRIGATDPTTSLDEGDLFYNTTSNALKVYTGSAWEQGVTAGSGFLPTTGGSITGNLSVSGDLTVDTNTLYVDSTNNNVGIGTSSPSYQLDVQGAGNSRIRVKNTSVTGEAQFHHDGNGDLYIKNSVSGRNQVFFNDGAERMRIDASGNVGIGTSSPSALFTVEDSGPIIEIKDTASSTYTQLANVSGDTYIGGDRAGVGGKSIIFRHTGVTEAMRIDSSGNVDIGSTGGGVKLAVAGAVGPQNGSAASPTHTFYSDTNTGMFRATVDTLGFSTAGSERMRIDSSGNLLVGKTSQTGAGAGIELQANGTFYVGKTGDVATFNRTTSVDGTLIDFQKQGTTVGSIGNASTGFYINGNSATSGLEFATNTIVPSKNAARIDGALNLGMSTNRFKDLYLSGGLRGDTTFKNNAGTTEYARFDSSGHLLVGKSTSAFGTQGIELQSDGELIATKNGTPIYVNRITTDGAMQNFYKDGSLVGSIASLSSRMAIGSGGVGLFFDNISSDAIEPHSMSTNSVRDAAINIGASGSRFKDAHFSGTVNAANFNTTSDSTLKTNVETLTGSLDAVKALRGVSFDWIENGNSEVGVIAQEVEAVVPDVVSTNDQGIKSVKYGNLVGVLIEAIKEQQAQIDELKAKLGD